jgi:chorismate synthase
MKLEQDQAQLLSGVMAGLTTGAPLAIHIQNRDHLKWQGQRISAMTAPRPGHVDLVGAIKYGYSDLRPALERASARETAARVAVGAICKHFLAQCGIQIGSYVTALGEITAQLEPIPLLERARLAEQSDVRCPDPQAAEKMQERIRQVMQEKDTLGGVIEVFAVGLPPGLGTHVQWDQRLEARLGSAILSVQAIKGVEIGPAFENARLTGVQVQDAIRLEGEILNRIGNRCGGIEGGISTGQPILIRAAMKPIASTLTPQATVDLHTREETTTQYERSDFCPTPRATPILEAMTAFVLADALLEKLGGDSMIEILPRLKDLRQAKLSDLHILGGEHIFWPKEQDL